MPVGAAVIVVSGGVEIDDPRARCRRRIDVADRVGDAHLERVAAWDSAGVVHGEVHAANAAPSSEHWNVAPGPASGDVNVNVAVVLGVEPVGPDQRSAYPACCVSTVHA